MNSNTSNLFFTMVFSDTSITFLDLSITKSTDGSLSSGLYRKETAGNTILHASSSHPKSLVASIPYGQYLRLRRNCSNDTDFAREANKLRERLLERGYSPTCLKKAFKRARGQLRHNILFSKKTAPTSQPTIRVITTYNKQHGTLKNILQKHWHLLQIDPNLKPHITATPTITYRKARSLGDYLVKSEYTGNFRSDTCKRLGTFTCGGCSCCRYMNTKNKFKLPNGRMYRPRHFSNCKTPGVVYLLTCQCGCFYVGKTKLQFHKRVARHITSMRQARWIANLNATQFPGLNTQMSFRPFLEGFVSGGCEKE